jgi:S-adenosylmethionine/arginine decarboxylase-like enzyme
MHSYHFIGVGLMSQTLEQHSADVQQVANNIARQIVESELQIVSEKVAGFENGGATLIWILAESHLVVHLWTDEGFATIDLHICDYETSNLERALRLKASLHTYCFDPSEVRWQEFTLPQPSRVRA